MRKYDRPHHTERRPRFPIRFTFIRLKSSKQVNHWGVILSIGSLTHIFSLLLGILPIFVLNFAFRNAKMPTKRAVIFCVAILNLFQHFFKPLVWPHMHGQSFGLLNTAYNVCAFLIILTPFAILFNRELLLEFVACVGTAAGAVTLLVPYWFFGRTPLSWEFSRAWTCHALLLCSSSLLLLLKLVRFRFRHCFHFGLLFIVMLSLILLNDTIVFAVTEGEAGLYERLLALNPLWTMGPTELYPLLAKLLESCSPAFLLGNTTHGYAPVLWYAVPFYILVTIIAFLLGALLDRDNFLGRPRAASLIHKKETRCIFPAPALSVLKN